MSAVQVNALYDAFVASLPGSLRGTAADLPHALGLAPVAGIRFSEVFSHEVTLGAPAMIAEAFPRVEPRLVRDAQMAHALAVIEAFGTDRVLDRQVSESHELSAILQHLRQARDVALERILPGASRTGALADQRSREAMASERDLLSRFASVDFTAYETLSLDKQAVGFPASLALARAAGADDRMLVQIERVLTGVWLGLQFEDDVMDWEDDWRNGGAWAVCLARSLRTQGSRDQRATEPDLVRRTVLATDVLRRLLVRSRSRYRGAWRRARALGALRLATWARQREARLDALIPLEAKFAGYAVRARRLDPWAVEVLA